VATESEQENSLANVDPLVAKKDSLDVALVENQQNEKETSWEAYVDEEDFKKKYCAVAEKRFVGICRKCRLD